MAAWPPSNLHRIVKGKIKGTLRPMETKNSVFSARREAGQRSPAYPGQFCKTTLPPLSWFEIQ
jgi:hypothetical protein